VTFSADPLAVDRAPLNILLAEYKNISYTIITDDGESLQQCEVKGKGKTVLVLK